MLLSSSPTAEWRRFDDSAALPRKHWVPFWFRINYYWPPFGENCAQLFWNFKAHEGIKYKSQFSKCSLQNYKICSRGTETSVICDEFAKAVAYLVEGNGREHFNNFDEAGVKVLEEKKSLTKAIFAVTSSIENKAWKKFRPVRDLSSWPLRYRCRVLPTELTSQLGVGHYVGSK